MVIGKSIRGSREFLSREDGRPGGQGKQAFRLMRDVKQLE